MPISITAVLTHAAKTQRSATVVHPPTTVIATWDGQATHAQLKVSSFHFKLLISKSCKILFLWTNFNEDAVLKSAIEFSALTIENCLKFKCDSSVKMKVL